MSNRMPITKPNKHELRTRETRELLLRAAETIFIRDGYERADLGEIAALAGRTKGAIYGQFKSKEDIFLALIEEKREMHRQHMRAALAESTSVEQNIKAYRQLCISMVEDPSWSLLLLEFKLFAIRHPGSRERLRQFYDEMLPMIQEQRLAGLLGRSGKGKNAIPRAVAVHSMQPMLSALAVEASFAPDLLDKEELKRVATRIFDALIG